MWTPGLRDGGVLERRPRPLRQHACRAPRPNPYQPLQAPSLHFTRREQAKQAYAAGPGKGIACEPGSRRAQIPGSPLG